MKRESKEDNFVDRNDDQLPEDEIESRELSRVAAETKSAKAFEQVPPPRNFRTYASRFFVLWLLGTFIGLFKEPSPADDPALQGSFLFHILPSAVGRGIGFLILPLLVSGSILFCSVMVQKRLSSTRFLEITTALWILFVGLSCAPELLDTTTTSTQSYTKPAATAVRFQPERCEYSVIFESAPRYYTNQKATADGELIPLFGAELLVSEERALVRAECGHVDYDLGVPSEAWTSEVMRQIALDLGLSRPNFAFESGSMGTIGTLTGLKDSANGRITVRVANYFGDHSVMTLYASSLSTDFQTPEMVTFLNSIERHRH